jgi:hypothetical protein
LNDAVVGLGFSFGSFLGDLASFFSRLFYWRMDAQETQKENEAL